jgi:hypothetical protein
MGALATLVPVAQATPGFQGSPDAIDRAFAVRQAELSSFQGNPDAVDRAAAAQKVQLTTGFDAREHAQLRIPRPAATGQPQYLPLGTSTSGFDWGDFGIGAGAGVGFMVLLVGLGLGALGLRRGQDRVTTT